jgi:transcriptional regulator with XRE-family HTH domain
LPETIKTLQESLQELAARVKARRLSLNLSQEGLATRAGVSAGTIKRFEKIGQISLDSLLAIAVVLGCSDDFDNLFRPKIKLPADDEGRKTASLSLNSCWRTRSPSWIRGFLSIWPMTRS